MRSDSFEIDSEVEEEEFVRFRSANSLSTPKILLQKKFRVGNFFIIKIGNHGINPTSPKFSGMLNSGKLQALTHVCSF